MAEGLQQDDLAADLGVTRAYLSQVENEKKEPSLAFLRGVSRRFDVPLPLLVIEQSEGGDSEILRELRLLVEKLLATKVTLWTQQADSG